MKLSFEYMYNKNAILLSPLSKTDKIRVKQKIACHLNKKLCSITKFCSNATFTMHCQKKDLPLKLNCQYIWCSVNGKRFPCCYFAFTSETQKPMKTTMRLNAVESFIIQIHSIINKSINRNMLLQIRNQK